MNLSTKNSLVYRQIKLFVPPIIEAILRGNVKPLFAYLDYLKLENNIKKKLIESFAGDLEDLKYALFNCGYIESKSLRLLALEKSIILEFPDKYKFYVNHLLDYLFAGLFHETQTFIFFKEHIRNAKVFVDVGANIGGYSIRAAKYSKVYAIEPLPRNYKILKINEKLNNVKINSFNIAAGNKNGKIKLFYELGHYGRPSIKRNYKKFVEVEMKPLDEIINEGSIDLIKIDVEGAEDLVLEGARNCLKITKMVIIEYNDDSILKSYKILKEEGFILSGILDNNNYLFVK